MHQRVLYQPLSIEKINEINIVLRKCSDRAEAMLSFCQQYFGESLKDKSYLDIGAQYGYFLNFFKDHVSSVSGFEPNENSYRISQVFYSNVSDDIENKDFIMMQESKKYSIVSFLSELHHHILQEDILQPEDIIDFIDEITEDLLFFEMGEEHESWFSGRMDGWNKETIPQWIIENTSFTTCEPLMIDNDNVGRYSDKFARTLFVCYRD